MAVQASASAPGKIILFGEHAVVYGYRAVAAALSDLRVHVDADLEASACEVHFCLEDLKCDITGQKPLRRKFSVENMVAHLGSLAAEDAMAERGAIEARSPTKAAVEAVERYLEHVSGLAKQALAPLVFLVASILLPVLAESNQGLRISIRSVGLPVGAGLGSSAALSVSTAAALLRVRYLASGGTDTEAGTDSVQGDGAIGRRPAPRWLGCINEWAYAAEVISTGHPSGIDNTVSCYGAAVECRKNVNNPSNTKITRVAGFPSLKILITDTCIKKKSTASLVAAVRQMRSESPEMTRAVDDVFQAMEACTDCFLGLANPNGGATSSWCSLTEPEVSRLQHLVRMNHGLLNAIGVGHPALDAICLITRKHGVETKLTGAGGGGCAYTVLKGASRGSQSGGAVDHAAAELKNLVSELEGSGFRCYTSSVAGQGVLWGGGSDSNTKKGGSGSVTRPRPVTRYIGIAVLAGAAWLVFRARK